MFDRILNQLKETRDRQAVMILLQGLDVPMAVLTIKSDLATGELWIEKGKYIVYAKVLPNGDGGLMDMLRMLAISEGEFSLETRDDKPPPCQVSIQLSEVVADEHAVARKIKNVLWPVDDSGPDDDAKEAETGTKKPKRGKKKTVEELEITRVRGAATDEALEAYVEKQKTAEKPAAEKPADKADKPVEDKQRDKPKTEKPDEKAPEDKPADKAVAEKPAEKPGEDKPQDKAAAEKPAEKPVEDKPRDKPVAEKPAEKPAEDKPPDKPEAAPTAGLKPEVAEAIGDRLDELFGDEADSAKPAKPTAASKPEFSDAAWEKVDQILSDKPMAGARAEATEEPSSSLSSLFDEDEESEEEEATSKPAAASAPAAAAQGMTAFELNAQMISQAAKTTEVPKSALASAAAAAVPAQSGASAQDAAAIKKVMKSTWEGLSPKQQAHYVAMSALLGEEPEQFYADADAHSQMTEESLDEQRKEEAAQLAQALAEDPDAFKVGKPKIVDPTKTNDELKSRRLADYEALKLFYAEEPEKFDEEVGLEDKLEEGGLTDFQKRILEISNEEGRARNEFEEVDDKLTAGPDIRPAWDPGEIPSTEALDAIPTPSAPPSGDDVEYVAQKVDSPYSDSAPEISLTTSLRKKLSLEAEQQSSDLITRIAKATHLVQSGAEGDSKRPPMGRFVAIGLAGTILIPVFVFVIWHYYDGQAQEDVAMQREAAEMADRSLAQKSMVSKPQEAFRMPAAPPQSPLVGSNESSSDAANADDGVTKQETQANYTWHPPKEGNGPTPDQVTGATKEMANADGFATGGNNDRALQLYTQAIHKYPSNALLRAKAARLCISMKKYKQAYLICFTGLDACQTRSDFDMLVSIIREIP